MGLPEDQNTGHIDEREEVVRDQEVAIMLSLGQGAWRAADLVLEKELIYIYICISRQQDEQSHWAYLGLLKSQSSRLVTHFLQQGPTS